MSKAVGAQGAQGRSVDPDTLAELRSLQEAGGPDVLAEMVQMFLGHMPARLTTLAVAADSGDGAAVTWQAHTLKGSCGIFGARRLADLCEELEEVGHNLELYGPDAAPDLMGKVEEVLAEFARVRIALEQYVHGN